VIADDLVIAQRQNSRHELYSMIVEKQYFLDAREIFLSAK